MKGFEEYAIKHIKATLAEEPMESILDVYAISFYIYDHEDDPRYPTLTLGYNTNARCQSCTPEPGKKGREIAYDAGEAKWNFAFWLQNDLLLLGEPESESGKLCEQWIKDQGLWYSDEEFDDAPTEEHCYDLGDKITQFFVDSCVNIAKQLHEERFIIDLFGRQIPIIIHELEYYEAIANQTKEANPPTIADEFVDWVMNW